MLPPTNRNYSESIRMKLKKTCRYCNRRFPGQMGKTWCKQHEEYCELNPKRAYKHAPEYCKADPASPPPEGWTPIEKLPDQVGPFPFGSPLRRLRGAPYRKRYKEIIRPQKCSRPRGDGTVELLPSVEQLERRNDTRENL